jgi:hypothetical protein
MVDCHFVATLMEEGAQLPFELESEPTNFIEYQHLVGDLIYNMITCPDLFYSINHLSRFVFAPPDTHMTTTKIILKYIKGTKDYGIFFSS